MWLGVEDDSDEVGGRRFCLADYEVVLDERPRTPNMSTELEYGQAYRITGLFGRYTSAEVSFKVRDVCEPDGIVARKREIERLVRPEIQRDLNKIAKTAGTSLPFPDRDEKDDKAKAKKSKPKEAE